MLDPTLVPLIAAAIAALAIAAMAYVVMYPYLSGERQKEKRIAVATEGRARVVQTRAANEAVATRRRQVTASLKDLEARNKSKKKITLRLRLEQAGLGSNVRAYWIASGVSGALCTVLAAAFLPTTPMTPILLATAGFIGALGVPRFALSKITERRMSRFLRELPNAIDVVVRGVKSGLPLNECLSVIAEESPDPVGPEFREVIEQQRVGVSLGEALERMANRVPLQEVRFFAIVVAIQQQSGGNLAEALNNLSTVLRDRVKMQMKIKALSSEAKASAMILGSLPPGVMMMLHMSAPDYIAPLFSTRTGNLFILVSLVWMTFGILTMRKMINFKI